MKGIGGAECASGGRSRVGVRAGRYAFYAPGPYGQRAIQFFRQCVGEERFAHFAGSERFAKYPYVAAKLFLSREDWNRYCWIEQHGSLDSFEE